MDKDTTKNILGSWFDQKGIPVILLQTGSEIFSSPKIDQKIFFKP